METAANLITLAIIGAFTVAIVCGLSMAHTDSKARKEADRLKHIK